MSGRDESAPKTRPTPYWLSGLTGECNDEAADLEDLLDKEAASSQMQGPDKENIAQQADKLKLEAERKKAELEKTLYNLKIQAEKIRSQLKTCSTAMEEMTLRKKLVMTKRMIIE